MVLPPFRCASLPFSLEDLGRRCVVFMSQFARLLSGDGSHDLGAFDLAGLRNTVSSTTRVCGASQ
jgi:hypothetical protein